MHILIVEDDIILGKNIAMALSDEHFQVEIAADGLSAERLLLTTRYDCVILDINLPGKDGIQLCKDLRTRDATTPVILLTAYDELEDKVEGYESGADDYLTKPFYMKELLLRIRSLIRRSASRNNRRETTDIPDIIKTGDLELHFKTQKIFRSGQEIILTPREFQILRRLMEAEGAPVSKKDLVKEIWGSIFEHNTNTIEVYINFLRNKIDKPFDSHLIRTRVGYGYYLETGD